MAAPLQESLSNLMGIECAADPGSYLGLPLILPCSKRQAHLELKGKRFKRISGWKSKLLSQAGRACLIRSVVSSQPTYFMSSFLLPHRYC